MASVPDSTLPKGVFALVAPIQGSEDRLRGVFSVLGADPCDRRLQGVVVWVRDPMRNAMPGRNGQCHCREPLSGCHPDKSSTRGGIPQAPTALLGKLVGVHLVHVSAAQRR